MSALLTTSKARDAFGWDIRSEETNEARKGATKVDGSGEEKAVAVVPPTTHIAKKEMSDSDLNVLVGMTKTEAEMFNKNDERATKEWNAFISARRTSNSIGDVGTGVWFESLAKGNDDAALSLVMRFGLPMKERREVWKRWAEGREEGRGGGGGGGGGTLALDDIESAAGVPLTTLEWKRYSSKAEECCKVWKETAECKNLSKATMHTIEVDLKRTMNTHPFFLPGGEGLKSLRKILVACALADEKVRRRTRRTRRTKRTRRRRR